jgi:hypothetical protein
MFSVQGSDQRCHDGHWTKPNLDFSPPRTPPWGLYSPPVGVWIANHMQHLRVITWPNRQIFPPRVHSITLWGDQPVDAYPQEHPFYMMLRWLNCHKLPHGSMTTEVSAPQTSTTLERSSARHCFEKMQTWNCWRIQADNPQVVELALNYARTRIATFTASQWVQEGLYCEDWNEIQGGVGYAIDLTNAEDGNGKDVFQRATKYKGWNIPEDYWIRTSIHDVAEFPALEDIPEPSQRLWVSAEARVLHLSLKGEAVKTKVVHLDGNPLNYQRDNLVVDDKCWLSVRAVNYVYKANRKRHRYRVSVGTGKYKDFVSTGDDVEKREGARLNAYRYARTLDVAEGRVDVGHVMTVPCTETETEMQSSKKRKASD